MTTAKPRKKQEPIVETYDLVSRDRKNALRGDVREALAKVYADLMDKCETDAERSIVATEYLQQHALTDEGANMMHTWGMERAESTRSIQKTHRLTGRQVASHLGLGEQRAGQILAYKRL